MNKLVTLRVPDESRHKLNHFSKETGRSKTYSLKKSLQKYLEDREDYLLTATRLEENNRRVTYAKMRKELGLDH